MKETMSFSKAVATCFSKLFTFEGRARRSEYWFFILFMFIIRVMFLTACNICEMFIEPDTAQNVFQLANPAVMLIFDVIAFFLGLSVSVRRLHDIDCSGWFVLLLSVVPTVLSELYQWYWPSAQTLLNQGDVSPAFAAGVLKTVILYILIMMSILITKIILYCRPGTEGPNTYGPDPIRIITTENK